MKERKKIDRTEERDESEKRRKDEKRRLAAKGIVAGSALAALGAGMYGLGRHNSNIIKKGGYIWKGKSDPKRDAALAKAIGLSSLGIGLPVTGLSAYEHYKYRKGKDDDNKA